MVSPKELDKKGHRLHVKVQDALESISHNNEKEIRVLNETGGTICLENDEYNLLVSCLEQVKFLPRVSREVNSMWDYLESTQEEKLALVE
jgi:hypothetical protein